MVVLFKWLVGAMQGFAGASQEAIVFYESTSYKGITNYIVKVILSWIEGMLGRSVGEM